MGVVLCGGKSVRMGADKGLLLLDNQTWASLVAQKFTAFNIPFVLSINNEQLGIYAKYFNPDVLIIDNQTYPGPLRGLLTLHQNYPNKDLMVLACDMLDMKPQTVQNLINNYAQQPDFDFYAYHNGNFWEPFCGIYTAKGLNTLNLKQATNFSLQNILSSGITQKNDILDMRSFKNYNTL